MHLKSTLPDICEDHPKAAEDQRQFSAVSVREGASENTEDDGANVLDPEDVGDHRGGLKVDPVLLLLTRDSKGISKLSLIQLILPYKIRCIMHPTRHT